LAVVDYSEHSLQQGSDATAICYMEIGHQGSSYFGVAMDDNIASASLAAIVAAANRIVG